LLEFNSILLVVFYSALSFNCKDPWIDLVNKSGYSESITCSSYKKFDIEDFLFEDYYLVTIEDFLSFS